MYIFNKPYYIFFKIEFYKSGECAEYLDTITFFILCLYHPLKLFYIIFNFLFILLKIIYFLNLLKI